METHLILPKMTIMEEGLNTIMLLARGIMLSRFFHLHPLHRILSFLLNLHQHLLSSCHLLHLPHLYLAVEMIQALVFRDQSSHYLLLLQALVLVSQEHSPMKI
jgi:hypothetical protein